MNVFVVVRDYAACECCGVESVVIAAASSAADAVALFETLERDRVAAAVSTYCASRSVEVFQGLSDALVRAVTGEGDYTYRVVALTVQ